MKRVNLKDYPGFWADFTARINDIIDPSAYMSGALAKRYIKEWYGMDAHIMHFGLFGEVYMLDRDYTSFLLRWA